MVLLGFSWFGPLLGTLSALIAFIGLTHQTEEGDPMEDLQMRLRHPVKYALLHPVRAIMRRR